MGLRVDGMGLRVDGQTITLVGGFSPTLKFMLVERSLPNFRKSKIGFFKVSLKRGGDLPKRILVGGLNQPL